MPVALVHHAKGPAEGPATMRSILQFLALAAALAAGVAQGRLFWQTYGATVPAQGACGCEWNINQDYFVPRTCAAGHYGLFSACKQYHYRSPACKYLSPVYPCYCTCYGPCRYRWKDHVYKERCGCTPLGDEYGPWKDMQKCPKRCLCMKNESCACSAGSSSGGCPSCGPLMTGEAIIEGPLCHVEPIGGAVLGKIAALPQAQSGGSNGMSMMGMGMGGMGMSGMGGMNGMSGGGMNPLMMNMGAALMGPAGTPTVPSLTPQNRIPKIPTPPAGGTSLPPVF
jgi:hypothetical protein